MKKIKINEELITKFIEARAAVAKSKPLIHSIASIVAMNDCANAVLALGAKPITPDCPDEVCEITAISKALTVTTANINASRAEAIMLSGRTATEHNIPTVIDMVGVTCSKMRFNLVNDFIEKYHPAVIKGNISEIKAVAGVEFENAGIDVSDKDVIRTDKWLEEGLNVPDLNAKNPAENFKVSSSLAEAAVLIKELSLKTGAVVMASGETDIISDGHSIYLLENGSANMANVTGTGCMLNVITGVYLAVTDPLTASLLAAATLSICGELADSSKGLGTYHISLIDELSKFTDDMLVQNIRGYEIIG